MKDEYRPRDLQYEKVKDWFKQELLGPSLKEMEANKRVLLAKNMWKEGEESSKPEQQYKIEEYTNNVREKDPLAFFDPDYLNKLRGKSVTGMHIQAQKFSSRLDQVLSEHNNNNVSATVQLNNSNSKNED